MQQYTFIRLLIPFVFKTDVQFPKLSKGHQRGRFSFNFLLLEYPVAHDIDLLYFGFCNVGEQQIILVLFPLGILLSTIISVI